MIILSRSKPPRRPRMLMSGDGITYIWRRNPFIAVWWSAAFPGFGQLLLNQYARGILLTLSEVIINRLGHVNEAMVYTFCGRFDLVRASLQPRWMYGYLVIYLYAIWNSYRSAITFNRLSHLAELENTRIVGLVIHPVEIQYLERKNPITGAFWSLAFPGLGQLYNQRVSLGIYAILWWWIFTTLSHTYDSLFLFLSGRLEESITLLDPQWLMFMPSVTGGSVYYAYITAVDQNHIFMTEQKQFFAEQYRGANVCIFPKKGMGRC